jgi:hypothetical protein
MEKRHDLLGYMMMCEQTGPNQLVVTSPSLSRGGR